MRYNWNKYFTDLVFDPVKHTYTIQNNNDIKFTSVTSIINDFKTNIFTDDFIDNYANKYGYSSQYVKDLWDIKKQLGALKGTEIHFYIESFYKYGIRNEVSNLSKKEIDYFYNFLNDHKFLRSIKQEYRIYDIDLKLAGTIDAIMFDTKSREYVIMDWKTNKQLYTQSNTNFKGILSDLEQTDINIYNIQLMLYKHILEKHIDGLKIEKLFLVHFNENNENYEKIQLDEKFSPYFERILKYIQEK